MEDGIFDVVDLFMQIAGALGIVIAVRLFWGGVSAFIADKKDRSAAIFFWIGFVLGLIGLIIAVVIPRKKLDNDGTPEEYKGLIYNRPSLNDIYEQETLSEGGWKCKYCGSLNTKYTGTCGCGRTKEESAAKQV